MRTLRPDNLLGLSLACLALVAGCDSPAPSDSPPAAEEELTITRIAELDGATEAAVRDLMAVYLDQAEADFVRAENDILNLTAAIDELLQVVDDAALNQARAAWLQANNSFEATLLHRYLAQGELSSEAALQLNSLNYALNYWPILPGYIDAVGNYPDSGIVHDVNVTITPESLRQVHGQFDLSEVSLGFHVLEFLLWGENPDRESLRPASDYQAIERLNADHIEAGLSLEQLPNNRRRVLLNTLTEILIEDFRASRALWSEARSRYTNSLADTSASVLLGQLLHAVNSMLTEELLVRSLYPLLNGNYQDSIPSPFSHSSQITVLAQLGSVERLLLDAITVDGNRLDGILAGLSPDFEVLFYQNLDASKECLALLYSDLRPPGDTERVMNREFSVVECINLLTNLIDQFQQIEQVLVQRQ